MLCTLHWDGKAHEQITFSLVVRLLTRWPPRGQWDHCTSCWIFNVARCTHSYPAAYVALLKKTNLWLFSFRLFLCVWPACSFAPAGIIIQPVRKMEITPPSLRMFHPVMGPPPPPKKPLLASIIIVIIWITKITNNNKLRILASFLPPCCASAPLLPLWIKGLIFYSSLLDGWCAEATNPQLACQ